MTTPRIVRKQGQSRRRRLSLESMERRELLTTYLVTNNTDSGNGSLRLAIVSANADPGNTSDLIQFQLPAGQLTIAPASPLPPISRTNITLDGTQQAGYTSGVPVVVINGASAGTSDGLDLTGGSDTISGLIINGFSGAGISISGTGNDAVTSSWIGTDATGLVASANAGDGIDISVANNTVGGSAAGQGVIISGNGAFGVSLSGTVANRNIFLGDTVGLGPDRATAVGNKKDGIFIESGSNNTIGGVGSGSMNVISANANGIFLGGNSNLVQGNFIGTDGNGAVAKPNTQDGILIGGGASGVDPSSSNTIGGTSSAQGNVISGNTQEGVAFFGAGPQNLIQGNRIGVAANGTSPLGNGLEGVFATGIPTKNETIGGTAPGAGNIIANNGSAAASFGVALGGAGIVGITILSNTIYNNAGGGISLGPVGNLGNGGQPAPTIAFAQTGGNQTVIQGQLTFATGGGKAYNIQFFTNPTKDPAGTFEGQTLIGSTTVTADAGGNATFKVSFPFTSTIGQSITATATQQGSGNTSAFSAAVPITQAPVADLAVAIAASPSPDDPFGTNEVYTITVTNAGPNDATNVVLTNTFDANSAILTATDADANNVVTTTSTTVTDAIPLLPAGQTVTLVVTITPIATGTISINSDVTSDQIDPNSGDNTATTTINVVPAADLQITNFSADPSPVAVGGQLTYVLSVTNNGPNNADNTQEKLTLPAGVSFNPSGINASQGTFTINGNEIDLAAGLVTAGSTVTLTVVVSPAGVGTLTATASAISDESDPDTSNNSSTILTQVQNAVDIGVTVVASPDPVNSGQALTYTATITNSGPSDATGVAFTDMLPTDVTFNSASASNGAAVSNNGATVSSDIGAIASGQSVVVTIRVTPTVTTGTITNVATVSDSTEVDTNASNNSVTTPVLVSPADLSVSIDGSPYPAITGQPLTYTLVVHNNGPAPATTIVASLNLPAGVTVDSVTSSAGLVAQLNGSILTATAANFGPGETEIVTIVVTPPVSTLLTATAAVTADQIDPNTANNTSTSVIPVSPTDVAVVATASTGGVLLGDPVNLTYFVENGGPTAANNVVFTEVLPANATVTSVVSGNPNLQYSIANGVLTWNVGQLAGSSFQALVVTVVPTATGTLSSTGTVTSTSYDSNPSNNSASLGVAATNAPGVFEFSSSNYAVPENGGSVTVTIERVHGTLGPASIGYTTGDGTAVAGVNYAATSGVVDFADGQTSATLLIPILQDRVQTPNLDFRFGLISTTAGAIGSPAATTITVVNVDRDLVPPDITSVVPEFNGSTIPAFVVNFTKPLDPASATNVANYGLVLSGNDYHAGLGFPAIPVAAVGYVPGSTSVTIYPSFALPLNLFYGLSINGSNAFGVRDYHGNLISGAGNGVAGGNYGTFVGLGTSLKYNDGFGNSVNLKLANGGLMLINRGTDGNALSLQILGPVAGRSRLTGGVVRGKFGTGATVIDVVTGLGAFGVVNSSLTTPPFYVLDPGFTPAPAPATTANQATALGAIVPLGPAFAAKKKATF